MSTRLRVIYVHGGTGTVGWNAINNMNYLCLKYAKVIPKGTLSKAKWITEMYAQIPAAYKGILFLLREPRKVSFSKSRFKQLCKHFNIANRKPKKQAVARGVGNGATPGIRIPRALRVPAPPIARVPGQRQMFQWNPPVNNLGGLSPARDSVSTTVQGTPLGRDPLVEARIIANSPQLDEWRTNWDRVVAQVPTLPQDTFGDVVRRTQERAQLRERARQRERNDF